MKKFFSSVFILAAIAASFSSCSKCYDCSHYVYTQNTQTGQTDSTKVTDEYCSASSEEVKKKEDNGYTCVEQ